MNLTQIFWVVVVLGSLVVLNGFLYKENKKVPEPQGCEELREACSSCPNVLCGGRNKDGENPKES